MFPIGSDFIFLLDIYICTELRDLAVLQPLVSLSFLVLPLSDVADVDSSSLRVARRRPPCIVRNFHVLT